MDPDRVKTIVEWSVPKSQHDIQVFLGFTNLYWRFIERHSRIVLALTSLLCKGKSKEFKWGLEAQEAFNSLKDAFSNANVTFRPGAPIDITHRFIRCSNFRHHQPVSWWSTTPSSILVAQSVCPQNIITISTTASCSDHRIPQALLWRSPSIRSRLCPTIRIQKSLWRAKRSTDARRVFSELWFCFSTHPRKGQPGGWSITSSGLHRECRYSHRYTSALRMLHPQVSSVAHKMSPLEAHWNRIGMHANTAPEASLRSRFIATLEKDPLTQKLREEKEIKKPWSWQEDRLGLLHDNLVYVPHDDAHDALHVELMQTHHDDPLADHYGVAKTLELLSCNYYFPDVLLRQEVRSEMWPMFSRQAIKAFEARCRATPSISWPLPCESWKSNFVKSGWTDLEMWLESKYKIGQN